MADDFSDYKKWSISSISGTSSTPLPGSYTFEITDDYAYKHKIGQRVTLVRYVDDAGPAGATLPSGGKGGVDLMEEGTVCSYDGGRVGVRWDKKHIARHDCRGKCEKGHGWYMSEDAIEVTNLEDEKKHGVVSFLSNKEYHKMPRRGH
jgi:hypothetical protein